MSRRAQRFAWVALLAYLLVPLLLTLSDDAPTQGLLDFQRALQGLVDVGTDGRIQVSPREAESLANLLMFIPIGLLLRFALPTWRLTGLLLVCAVASLGIEVAQYLFLPGRIPTLVDVVNNGGGAAIGLVLASDLRTRGCAGCPAGPGPRCTCRSAS